MPESEEWNISSEKPNMKFLNVWLTTLKIKIMKEVLLLYFEHSIYQRRKVSKIDWKKLSILYINGIDHDHAVE